MSYLMEIILGRRSVRAYKPDPVPREKIFELIDAARWAPSGANIQPWHFIAVTDPLIKAEVGRSCKYFFIKSHHVEEAPLIVVILGDTKKSDWALMDCSMAAQNMMLRAHEMEMGSCFIGAFDEPSIREILKVPERYKIVGLITLGYPSVLTKPTPRLDVTDMSSFDRFDADESVGATIKSVRRSGPFSIVRKVIKTMLRL